MTDGITVTSPTSMGRGRALGWLAIVACIYLLALWYLDRDKHVLSRLSELRGSLGVCVLLVLCSYGLRYQRWHVVLRAQGHGVRWRGGLQAYLAGFAFTASPGKVGELLRIRYFSRLGVPAPIILATFIYERALDLLVITVLSAAAANLVPLFGVLASAVFGVALALCVLASWRWLQCTTASAIARLPGARLRQLARFLLEGVCALQPLLRPGLTLTGILYGAVAWLLTSAAFACLCLSLGIDLPWRYAFAIYPLAMLVGALSLVPGGVGTTEAAIVLMLVALGTPLDIALAIAIGIRLASLWLAVVVGMLSMGGLEARH